MEDTEAKKDKLFEAFMIGLIAMVIAYIFSTQEENEQDRLEKELKACEEREEYEKCAELRNKLNELKFKN